MSQTTKDWLLFGLAAALFLFFIALHGHAHFSDIDRIPWPILVPVAASLAFVHSWYMLGWRRASVLIACATLLSLSAEWVGQSNGWLFGPYCYTSLFGPKIGGRIPYLIPFAWYMMFYPSYVIANLVAEGRAVSNPSSRVSWVVWMALLSAAVMTAWDITMDPIMSFEAIPGTTDAAAAGATTSIPAWRWLVAVAEPTECAVATRLPPTTSTHFGVPWQNYQGWMVTSFVVFLVYRFLERRIPVHRRDLHWKPLGLARLTAIMPVSAYMAMALIDAVLGSPRIQDVHLISPFAMGITAAIASITIFTATFAVHHDDAPNHGRPPEPDGPPG
ncbi:MAG: carotenoid biosynthesis protein [Gemmatimonadota bacterium]